MSATCPLHVRYMSATCPLRCPVGAVVRSLYDAPSLCSFTCPYMSVRCPCVRCPCDVRAMPVPFTCNVHGGTPATQLRHHLVTVRGAVHQPLRHPPEPPPASTKARSDVAAIARAFYRFVVSVHVRYMSVHVHTYPHMSVRSMSGTMSL